jgi:predicted NUDIX family phosphoesterase
MSDVLVFKREHWPSLPQAGAMAFSGWPSDYQWMPRQLAEHNEDFLQLIPYLMIQYQEQWWCYQRIGGDNRLTWRKSCGVGGHIDRSDDHNNLEITVRKALLREIDEELSAAKVVINTHPKCWIYEHHSAVGRVHLGLVFTAQWPSPIEPQVAETDKLHSLGFLTKDTILNDDSFELWSHLAVQYLSLAQNSAV